ncbi:MAG: cytochrome-c oxidase, cbb3-type subunit I [Chthoniobacterales bacterium]|nr:cytochrome-c oxidase, cbb3-type subunit I [Chthoniobacterales bacterium]
MSGSQSEGKVRVEYNDTVVRWFLLATVFWGLVGMLAGVVIAGQLAFYQLNFDTSWLTFGRLRPLHTNAAIFAFVGNMIFAGVYYSTQRLVRTRLASDFLSWVHFWGWQAIIVAAAITLPLGLTRGKEYAELIWPINIAVVVIWVVFAVNFFWTLAIRNEKSLYVAIWFYIATIVTVAMLYVGNHLQIPTSLVHSYPLFAGVQDALVQWWYGHNAVAFFLTTPILGIMYYFVPKAAERPVYSYRLSVVHFWSLVFIYIWAGPHHLLNTALPEWLQTLGMVFSLMLWAPSWGGMLNGLLTLRGAWHKLRTDPVLKFFAAGVTFYGMATFEGPLLAIRSVNAVSHYTDWTIGHVHSGTLGWNSFMAAGMIYWLVPRLWGTKLWSPRLADIHFWIGMVGILLYIAAMWVSGITQGLMLNAVTKDGVLAHPNFLDAVTTTWAMLVMRLIGGAIFFSGFVLLGYNVYRTIRSGKPVTASVEVGVRERMKPEGMGLWRAFWNAPVIYSFLIILFGTLWGLGKGAVSTVSFVLLVETALVAMIHMSVSGAKWSEWYERLLQSWIPFSVLTFVAVVIGGAIQILPLVFMDQTVKEDGGWQRVYTPLELAGREVYISEGCYVCHSQMIRPFVGEVLRYGGSGRLAHSIYDRPFQWGSKRTGPDLQRVGGKYPNLWHFQHMMNPRTTSPGSTMPNYPWLFEERADWEGLAKKIEVQRKLGVPFPNYTQEEILARCLEQGRKITEDLAKSGIEIEPDRKIIALIAYLQQLGQYEEKPVGKEVGMGIVGEAGVRSGVLEPKSEGELGRK